MFSWKFLSDIVAPTLCVCWIAYFGFGAIFGSTGYLALERLRIEEAVKAAEVEEIEDYRDTLEARAKLLHPKSLDPDMVDEKIRSVLGYARQDDIVIPKGELDRLIASFEAGG